MSRSSRDRRAFTFRAVRKCDSVEPRAQLRRHLQGGGLAGQDQECRLKGILGVMQVAKRVLTDAQDHRPMPLDERFKRVLSGRIALRHEPLEQLLVGHAGGRAFAEEDSDQGCG